MVFTGSGISALRHLHVSFLHRDGGGRGGQRAKIVRHERVCPSHPPRSEGGATRPIAVSVARTSCKLPPWHTRSTCPPTRPSPWCCRAAARSARIRPASIEGLHEAGIQPNWFAGISIGAVNAAILAGNAPEIAAAAPERVLGHHLPLGLCCRTDHRGADHGLGRRRADARGDQRARRRPHLARRAGRILRPARAAALPVAVRRDRGDQLLRYRARSRRHWNGWSISTGSMRARRASPSARSISRPAISPISTMLRSRSSRSTSWRPAPCRRAFRRWRSKAGIIGMAGSSPTRRWPKFWATRRAATPSRSRSICGAPSGRVRTTSWTWRSARRTSAIPAAPAWRPTRRPSCSACAAP